MKKIVIADDSGMARSFIKRALEMVLTEDVEYVEAKDGKDALAKMKVSPPDLLVTDLNMPNMDGAELLRRVIASPKLHETPSIVVTSLLNPAKKKQLEEYGVSRILGKPLNQTELAEAIENIFGKEEQSDDGSGW